MRRVVTAAFRAGRGAVALFFLPGALFTEILPAFLLGDLAEGFAAFLRAVAFPVLFADFLLTFFVAFFLTDFLGAVFFAFFREAAAGFFRTDVLFFDAFFAEDFFALTLRLLPAAFLLADDFRDAVVFLPVAARFCFLLAAFFVGMFHSCRSEKNAELYIGCPNMEAQTAGIVPATGTLSRRGTPPVRRGRGASGMLSTGARDACDACVDVVILAIRIKRRNFGCGVARSPMSDLRDNRLMRRITLH